jgi:hypothetical protein
MEFFAEYKSIFIILHALAAAVGLGATTVTDALFFDFLKDFTISEKEQNVMKILSRVLWMALGMMVLTGIALFLSDPARYSISSKFLTKMIIVIVIILNGLLLNIFLHPRLLRMTFEEMHPDRFITRIAFASGAMSLISWYTVFILGSIRSIPVNVGIGIAIYGVLIVGGITISQIVCKSYISKHKHFVK